MKRGTFLRRPLGRKPEYAGGFGKCFCGTDPGKDFQSVRRLMAKQREWTIRKVETGIFRCPGAEIDYLRVHAVYRRRGCSVCNGRRPAVGRYNGTPLRPVRRLLVRMRYPKCIGIVECFADELHRHRQTGPAEPAADHDGRITSDRKRHAAMRVRPFRQTWIQPGGRPGARSNQHVTICKHGFPLRPCGPG